MPYPFIWITALAIAYRLIASTLLFSSHNPLFDPATFQSGDIYENYIAAKALLENFGRPEGSFIHGPLYLYLVAACLWMTGGMFWSVYVLQIMLGAAASGFICLATRRLFGPPAGIIAGVFAALYAPTAYYETIMTGDSMIMFLVALLIYLGAVYEQEPERRWWALPLGMGAVLGALTLLRGNLCLIGLGLAAWLLWGRVDRTLKHRLGATSLIAAVSILMILPACAWNTKVVGKPRFVVGESSIIWRFAWSVDSPGYFYYPKDYPNSELLAPTSPRIATLAATKVGQFFSWFEFPDLTNQHLFSRLSPPIKRNPLTFRLLSPLGLLGLFLAARRVRALALLYGCCGSILVASVLFYISGRYRLAILPIMFAFAGHAVVFTYEGLRAFDEKKLIPALGFGVLAFFLVNRYDPSRLHSEWHGDAMFGNYCVNKIRANVATGSYDEALVYAERLMWIAIPDYKIFAHQKLGEINRAMGNEAEAVYHLREFETMGRARDAEPAADWRGKKFNPPST